MDARFELLTNMGAGLGCLGYAVALGLRPSRPRLLARFARLLTVVGVALVLRAAEIATGTTELNHVTMLVANLFPLFAALYVEDLALAPLHLPAKIVLLCGTVFFSITALTPLIVGFHWWAISSLVYELGSLVYLLAFLAARLRRARKAARVVLLAHIVGGACVVPLLATDWYGSSVGSGPMFGAVGVFALLYVTAAALHDGALRLRVLAGRLCLAAAAVAVLAALITFAADPVAVGDPTVGAPDGRWRSFGTSALVLFFAYLIGDPLRRTLLEWRQSPREALLERLAVLPTGSFAAWLGALRSWPEIRSVEVVPAARVSSLGCDRLRDYMLANPGALDRETALAQARRGDGEPGAIVAAEQAALFLDSTDAEFGLPYGDDVVALSFSHVVDDELKRTIARHLYIVTALHEARR